MQEHKSKRIIRALLQLEQFTNFEVNSDKSAVHMLTGAVVTPQLGDDFEEGILSLSFPGAPAFDVIGEIYLQLQIAESATHEMNLDPDSKSPIAIRSNELSEHFARKYDL